MELSHEDIVTRILSKREILNGNKLDNTKMYSTVPIYDLTHYLNNYEPEPNRWGVKYKFVK